MSKSVLVIDTPTCCYTCPCYDEWGEECKATQRIDVPTEYRPSWCPLKPLPEKKEVNQEEMLYRHCPSYEEQQNMIDNGMKFGWNKCFYEILGETE